MAIVKLLLKVIFNYSFIINQSSFIGFTRVQMRCLTTVSTLPLPFETKLPSALQGWGTGESVIQTNKQTNKVTQLKKRQILAHLQQLFSVWEQLDAAARKT